MTPATDETDLAHVYGEDGTQYIVDVRHGSCTCDDYTYRHDGEEWRCKHGHRAFVAVNGGAPLPQWADRDALDSLLIKRLGLEADR